MIVHRWQALQLPNRKQIENIFIDEDLSPQEEVSTPEVTEQYTLLPYAQVRIIVEGQMMMDVDGNKVLLKQGDRIILPANTKHKKYAQGTEKCISLVAHKVQ